MWWMFSWAFKTKSNNDPYKLIVIILLRLRKTIFKHHKKKKKNNSWKINEILKLNFTNKFEKKVYHLNWKKKLSMLEFSFPILKWSSHISQILHHSVLHSPIVFTIFLKVSPQIVLALVNKSRSGYSLKIIKCSYQKKARINLDFHLIIIVLIGKSEIPGSHSWTHQR